MNALRLLNEGLRMYRRHLRVRGKQFTSYSGDATTICEAIIADRWNGTCFTTGAGNYPQFYARDFGMSMPALLQLGYRKECLKTLHYALKNYAEHGKITTHLTPKGKPISFPAVYSPDSTAYLLRSVRLIDNADLCKRYKQFLQQAVNTFVNETLDRTGRVQRHKHLCGMRDHVIRDAACYDTVMAAIVQREAEHLGLEHPFADLDYERLLVEDYWNGAYFKDDRATTTLTADANIYPFWHDIVTDKHYLEKAIMSMQHAGLDKPYPIKYVASNKRKGKTILAEHLSKDWEADSVWPMSGLPYIDVLAKLDKEKARQHHHQYGKLIEEYRTFIEVYGRDGKPYHSPFFSADEGMIWCAQWLAQKKLFR